MNDHEAEIRRWKPIAIVLLTLGAGVLLVSGCRSFPGPSVCGTGQRQQSSCGNSCWSWGTMAGPMSGYPRKITTRSSSLMILKATWSGRLLHRQSSL